MRIIATIGAVALMATAAFAQKTTAGSDTSGAAGTTAAPAGQNGATATAGAAGAATAGSVDEKDRKFVEKAAVGGLFEVQSSELALQKAQGQEVKTFAQQMVTDHTKANQQLMQLAKQKGITPPASLDEKHSKMMEKLQGSSEFDKDYLKQQLAAHKQVVKLFTENSQSLKDPDLKNFASQTLPVLQQHLTMVQGKSKAAGISDDETTGAKGEKKGKKGNKEKKDKESE